MGRGEHDRPAEKLSPGLRYIRLGGAGERILVFDRWRPGAAGSDQEIKKALGESLAADQRADSTKGALFCLKYSIIFHRIYIITYFTKQTCRQLRKVHAMVEEENHTLFNIGRWIQLS